MLEKGQFRDLPKLGTAELNWDWVRSAAPSLGSPIDELRSTFERMRLRVCGSADNAESDLPPVRGERRVDFATFNGFDPKSKLDRIFDPTAVQLLQEAQICGVINDEFLTFRGWSFFGTNLTALAANPDAAYGTQGFHSDSFDPRYALNGEMDGSPFLLVAPKNTLLGTEILVPTDVMPVQDDGVNVWPALCSRNPIDSTDETLMGVIQNALSLGRIRLQVLSPGDCHFVASSVIHRRQPLPEGWTPPIPSKDVWRYMGRLNFGHSFF